MPETKGNAKSETSTLAGSECFFPDGKRKIMRLFICYEDERRSMEVPAGKTVGAVKKMVQDLFLLDPSQAQLGDENQEKNSLVLSYYGAELPDHWLLSDLGISAGSSLRAYIKEELDPVFHFFVAYNQETIHVMDRIKLRNFSVADLRGMASRRTGLPVGVFRIVSAKNSLEMFDCHLLEEYGIKPGDTFRLETWDGWNNFLTLCALGFTSHVIGKISTNDDLLGRFQAKVALYMAAHFGHVDLAVTLMSKMGCRSDEPVGEHPFRQWCNNSQHLDFLKAPVHEAVEAGQLSVLRTFVHHNVCCIMARDGNGLQPLNIALRQKRKECASFLLTKQWSRINFGTNSIALAIFSRMKSWSERARDKVQLLFGVEKSSTKKKVVREHPLVGQGVYIDGYSDGVMCSRSKAVALPGFRFPSYVIQREEVPTDPEDYFKGMIQVTGRLLPKQQNKWSRMAGATNTTTAPTPSSSKNTQNPVSGAHFSVSVSRLVEENDETTNEETNNGTDSNRLRLPPIGGDKRGGTQRRSSVPMDGFELSADMESSYEDSGTPMMESKDLLNMTKNEAPTTSPGNAAGTKKKLKKPRDSLSAQLLAKAKATEGSIPLPLTSVEDTPRPFFFVRPGERNVAQETIDEYERYRGMKSRNYAIQCLSVSNIFRKKPWLSQVRMAMDLSIVNVKKPVDSRQRPIISIQKPTVTTIKEEEASADAVGGLTPRLGLDPQLESSRAATTVMPSVRSGTTLTSLT